MIVIDGTMQLHPDDREAMLEAFGPIQAATRADEPGCLAYAFSADPLSADGVLIYEHWADAAALDAHFNHPNFANARAVLGGFRRLGASMRKYRIDAAAEIYIDGKPSTAFPSE